MKFDMLFMRRRFLRTALMYFIQFLICGISGIIFNIGFNEYYSGIPYPGMLIICVVGFCIISHTFLLFDTVMRDTFLAEACEKLTIAENIKAVFKAKDTVIQALTLLIMTFIIPGMIFYGIEHSFNIHNGILIRAVEFAIYIFCLWGIKFAVFRKWHTLRNSASRLEETSSVRPIYHRTAYTFGVCTACAAVLIIATPMAISFLNLFSKYPIAILFAVLIAFFILVMIRYGKAVLARRKFIKQFKKVCAERGFKSSEIKAPYTSLFSDTGKINFSVDNGNCVCDCRLFPQFSKKYKAVFKEDGNALLKIPLLLFSKDVTFNYSFDSPNLKVLIFTPDAYNIYARTDETDVFISKNESLYGYRILTAEKFLNDLKYNSFDKK